jgi:hypothetical protein
MIFLPGLTSTKKERIPRFLDDMEYYGVSTIALFPTCLDRAERQELYERLERFQGLRIPHVHLRADCRDAEIDYLRERFETKAFNIHPAASSHPFGEVREDLRRLIFVENVVEVPLAGELSSLGGLCPDFSHWENAVLHGAPAYSGFEQLAESYPIGCCHISAIRPGDPNDWSGQWDHHAFKSLSDFDYLGKYRAFMPASWRSLELENDLSEQLAAIDYLQGLLA